MRVSRLVLPLVVLALSVLPSLAQQVPAAGNPQAIQLLQRALSAITKGAPLQDITLTGTARRITGSDDETGQAILKALGTGESRIDLNLPSGQRSEVRAISNHCQVGSWSCPDGIVHPVPNHNLSTDPGWFPAYTLVNTLAAQGAVIAYQGPETRDGQSVIHLTVSLQFAQLPADAANLTQHLSQTEIFLDANTLLPAALSFNIHPDDNALLDIPIEIRFSGYRPVNGAQVPFHVQKFLNNGLILDLQFQTVTINSGLTASSLSM